MNLMNWLHFAGAFMFWVDSFRSCSAGADVQRTLGGEHGGDELGAQLFGQSWALAAGAVLAGRHAKGGPRMSVRV